MTRCGRVGVTRRLAQLSRKRVSDYSGTRWPEARKNRMDEQSTTHYHTIFRPVSLCASADVCKQQLPLTARREVADQIVTTAQLKESFSSETHRQVSSFSAFLHRYSIATISKSKNYL
uniref:Uncharacterized protein n=1 Tax=Leersia perrieri TaxID=77586 RepID=A0A0D9XYK5_9ORYZ